MDKTKISKGLQKKVVTVKSIKQDHDVRVVKAVCQKGLLKMPFDIKHKC